MTPTPDFDVYDDDVVVSTVIWPRWVEVTWSDGVSARFHHLWLRDNCACSSCVHPITKEQTFELDARHPPSPLQAAVGASGALLVTWTDEHLSTFHPGWLRAHGYDRQAELPPPASPWDRSTPDIPPTFDGPAVMEDDGALLEWLTALREVGFTRLVDVPCELDEVGRVAARIGPIRETNFGVLWDVRSEPAPVTNANTPLALPPHVDLCTREYQPGLQFLHCVRNTAAGGRGRYVDGFRVAKILREEQPVHYRVLTTEPMARANRSMTSDYRWSAPPIVLDRHGTVTEIRWGNWLRAPLAVDFDAVEAVYAAGAALAEVAGRDDLAVDIELQPGDLIAFDNRRILHGRSAFDTAGGERLLRGCYSERDELLSRLRVLERQRRLSEGPPRDGVGRSS